MNETNRQTGIAQMFRIPSSATRRVMTPLMLLGAMVLAPLSTARAECGGWSQVTAVTGTINYSYSHAASNLFMEGKAQESSDVSFRLDEKIGFGEWRTQRLTGIGGVNNTFTFPRNPPPPGVKTTTGSGIGPGSGVSLTIDLTTCEYRFSYSHVINAVVTTDSQTIQVPAITTVSGANRSAGGAAATLSGSGSFSACNPGLPPGCAENADVYVSSEGVSLLSFAENPAGAANVSWTFTPVTDATTNGESLDDPCSPRGSLIACENQSLGAKVEVTGTPYALHYQSERTEGYHEASAAAITLAQGLGGWTLDMHHAYDPLRNTLYLGDGGRRSADALGLVTPTVQGTLVIAAEDGSDAYVFDLSGRHLRTLNALTGAVRHQFSYDNSGRLTTIADGEGNVTSIKRNANGDPTDLVSASGQKTALSQDSHSYLSKITNPAAQSTQLTYSTDGLLTTLADARGGTHRFSYNAQKRLIKDEDPENGFKTLARTDQPNGYQVSLKTALGRTTTYDVENLAGGQRRRITTFPDGLQTVSQEDPAGTIVNRFPDGVRTSWEPGVDPRWGKQVSLAKNWTIATPGGLIFTATAARTATLADPANPLSVATQTDTVTVNDHTYTGTYTAATKTYTGTTPESRQVSTTVDTQGRVVQKQIAGLLPTSYVYDSRGRLSVATQGSGATSRSFSFSYNTLGYLSTITDPLGRKQTLDYDTAGRASTQTLADGQVVRYEYDASGNLRSVTPPGRPAHSFTFTPGDLPLAYSPPNVGAGVNRTEYVYNADEQVTRITRPDNEAMNVAYDTAGRVSALTIARGLLTFGYDPTTGNPAMIAAPGAIGLTYSYDGELLTGETWAGVVAGRVNATHDKNFRVISRSINGADAIGLQYDNDGLLVGTGALTLTRNALNGLLTGSTLGSVTDTVTYSGFAEPINYNAATNGTSVYTVQYTRDKLGRVTQKIEAIGGVTAKYAYIYDVAGHLKQTRKNSTTVASYTYDGNGNRLTLTGLGGVVNGTYDDQDRLVTYGSTTYRYTANGELLSKTAGTQTTGYQYDALGNLLGVTLPGGSVIDYLIDGRNRRVGKKVNGTLVQALLYQGLLRPIAELDGSGTIVSRFVYATHVNVPDYIVKGGVTYRIITDHLGSPRLVVDVVTGAVAQRIDYDEFGQVLNDSNPGFQPFGFGGGLYDWETRLVRFGVRDYDAATGRWTARDPALFLGDATNLYAFVGSDPVNKSDPLGLDPNLNLFDTTDVLHSIAQQVPSEQGVYIVVGHGNSESVQLGLRWVSPEMLLKKISMDPKYKDGMKIKLLTCSAARGTFAKELRKLVKGTVEGPTGDIIWSHKDGKLLEWSIENGKMQLYK